MNKVAVKVIMYIKPSCPYCINAKKFLDQKLLDHKDIQYEEVNVNKNPELFHTVKSTYNVSTVPQIFIIYEDGNKTHINGYSELMRLDKAAKLDDMLYTTINHDDNDVDHNNNSSDIDHNNSTEYKSKSEHDTINYSNADIDNTDVNYDSGTEIVLK